jgi:pimeloyl-ACP methyl ester carboxylesterase
MKILKRILLIGFLLLIIGVMVFFVWAETPLGPMPEAILAMQSDESVIVTTGEWLEFHPADRNPETGIIIYPGGRIDPRSYAPAANALARQGYLAAIVPMPLNLAVFDPDRAEYIVSSYPEIQHWAVGGHSLGGAMAASYIKGSEKIRGLFLWASYPPNNVDLSQQSLEVTSIYGSLDGLSTVDDILSTRFLLPEDTSWVEITGGNHGQFGWYGPQPGDNPATISREEQQSLIVQATAVLLQQLDQ